MVIVVAIVLVLVTLVLPASSQMWRDRRIADAQNMISGMLMTARAQALQADFGESGLFFYVDNGGTQRVVAINQDSKVTITDSTGHTRHPYVDPEYREAWSSVFSVVPERQMTLPPPMRVVPRVVAMSPDDPSLAGQSTDTKAKATFSPEELANNDVYRLPSTNSNQAQRHRNFFTMIYSSDGRLQPNRDVVIRDVDSDPAENSGGDVTGLHVPVTSSVLNTYNVWDDRAMPIDPRRTVMVDNVVIDESGNAINFPSTDGVMVYDDSQFASAGDPDRKRQLIVETGQPFYVHRVTGAVVRGPIGETVAQVP